MKRGLRRELNITEDKHGQEFKEQIAKEIDNSIIYMLVDEIKGFSNDNRKFDLAHIIYNTCGMGIVCDILNDIHDYKESEINV